MVLFWRYHISCWGLERHSVRGGTGEQSRLQQKGNHTWKPACVALGIHGLQADGGMHSSGLGNSGTVKPSSVIVN